MRPIIFVIVVSLVAFGRNTQPTTEVQQRDSEPRVIEFRGIRPRMSEAEVLPLIEDSQIAYGRKPSFTTDLKTNTPRVKAVFWVLPKGDWVLIQSVDGKVANIIVIVQQTPFEGYLTALADKYGAPKERATKAYHNGLGNEFHAATVLWEANDSYIQAEEVCGEDIPAKLRNAAITYGAITSAASNIDGGCITFGDYKLMKELNMNAIKPQI